MEELVIMLAFDVFLLGLIVRTYFMR